MFCSRAEAREISYSFEIKDSYIEVTCLVQGNDSGKTQFSLPELFDLDPSQPKKIKVYVHSVVQPQGVTLDVIDIVHPPLADIKIIYELHKIIDNDANLYFNITLNNFFFLAQYCLIIPQLPKKELNKIKFEFPAYHKRVFSNVDHDDSKARYLTISISELKNYFFAGGEIKSITLDALASEILFIGELPIKQKEIRSYLTKVQSIHNNFFINDKQKNYYIFLLSKQNPYNIHGIASYNFRAIALGYQSKFDYDLKHMIAHENLHQWFSVNNFGETSEIQGSNCWLIEGVTDYYTDYLNYKNGLLSIDQYLKSYNNTIVEYYTSPFRYLTNDEIAINPYDNQIFFIAYLRGRIIAHELNYLIQKLSNNKVTLDDYIKHLLYLTKTKTSFHFSPTTLDRTLGQFLKQDVHPFIKQYFAQNNVLVAAESILDGKARLTMKTFKKTKYDFEFAKSCLEWSVYGVKPGSKAFKAGLRNGQKIVEVTNAVKEVVFKIATIDGFKLIKLITENQEILIPQYQLSPLL